MNEIPTEKLLPQGLKDMLNAKRECMAQANDIHNEIIDREIGRVGNIMKKTVRITTCMRGLQKWIDANPRKNLRGFFTVNGRDMSHNEVKRIVAYAVSKGYETERDIPSEELAELLDK